MTRTSSPAIEWAAGISVSTAATPVPDNPYPANIINLSLGGAGSCISAYQIALNKVTSLGALIVVSAGNASAPSGRRPTAARWYKA